MINVTTANLGTTGSLQVDAGTVLFETFNVRVKIYGVPELGPLFSEIIRK